MVSFTSLFRILCLAAVLTFAVGGNAFAAGKKGGGSDTAEQGAVDSPPSAHSGKSRPGDPIYVRISPMVLPIIGDDGIEEIVSMIFYLEVDSMDTSDKVREKLPRLVDGYMQSLYGALERGSLKGKNGKTLDIARIKQRITAVNDRILGTGVVQEVLVQAVNQRQMNPGQGGD
jgi:flagellar protein FliL